MTIPRHRKDDIMSKEVLAIVQFNIDNGRYKKCLDCGRLMTAKMKVCAICAPPVSYGLTYRYTRKT